MGFALALAIWHGAWSVVHGVSCKGVGYRIPLMVGRVDVAGWFLSFLLFFATVR